ncbi:MAG: hypothetical protein ACXVUE_18220 [Solirubrobacteraceae bacterium]
MLRSTRIVIVHAPPRSPDHDQLEALIEEARVRARRRRRRNGAAAVVAALVIVGGYLLVAQAGGDRASSSVRAARSSSAPLSIGVGPFWYMRTIGTMRAPRCVTQRPGVMHRCASTVWFDVVMSTETWVGTDATMRERSVEVSQRFASAPDRARWLATGRPVPVPISIAQGDALDVGSGHFPSPVFGEIAADVPPTEGPPTGVGPVDVGDGLFSHQQLLGLPGSGPTALATIDRAWSALRHRYATMLLRWHSPGARLTARENLAPIARAGRSIQELLLIAHLDAAPVPAHVRLALFHAAAALPGATVVGGPTGVTVSAAPPHWQPVSFTFDPRTGELETGLPMDGGPPDVPGPASTVVAQGPVDSVAALPNGARPIRGVGAPPLWPSPSAPPAESVVPAVGEAHTVLTVLLAATPGEHAHPAPRAWLGITGSAGRGIYHAGKRAFAPGGSFLPGNQGIDLCLPTASARVWPVRTIHRAGALVFVYQVAPRLFHLRAWCAGRYQLGIQTFPNPLPPHYTTPPYTGPSGTSVYFEIH